MCNPTEKLPPLGSKTRMDLLELLQRTSTFLEALLDDPDSSDVSREAAAELLPHVNREVTITQVKQLR